MDNILLVIPDWDVRQLYHELLLSEKIEVIPTDKIENAIMLFSLYDFDSVFLYVDERNEKDVETFIRLRKKHLDWSKIKLFLLLSDADLSQDSLHEANLVMSCMTAAPSQVIRNIQLKFKKNDEKNNIDIV